MASLSDRTSLPFSDGASVTFSYDPDSNLKSLTGTDQQATRFTYYRDGLLNEVRVETDGLPDKIFKYHYDAAGRLERLEYPGESSLILYLTDTNNTPGSGYDGNGNLLHMRYEINGVPVRSFHYTYDKSGNRETLEIITPSKTSFYQFGYDWFDRLTTVSQGINGAPPALLRVYEFDEADNRRFFDDYAQGTSGATYYYTYKGYGAYSSDQVEAIYIYPGAAGHRNVEDFVQLHEALEYDDDGNLTKKYGGLVSQSTDFRSEKTFVGALSVHDDLPDSGLYLMGHRHYDSNLGRFISRDPIGFAGGLALYGYPTNPVTAVDPSGLAWWNKAVSVYQYLRKPDGTLTKRLIGKLCESKGGREKRAKQLENLMDKAVDRNRPLLPGTRQSGGRKVRESPRRGFGVEFEDASQKDAEKAAAYYDPNGQIDTHAEANHCHTVSGKYADVEVAHDGSRGHFYWATGLAGILAPQAADLVALKTQYPEADISLGNVIAAGLFDVVNTVDPVGVSDGILWLSE